MGITKQQLLNTVEQLKAYNDESTSDIESRIEQLVSSKQVIVSNLSFCLYGGSESTDVKYSPNEDITKILISSKYINEGITVNTENSYIELKAGHTYKLEAFIWSYYSNDNNKIHYWAWYNKDTGEVLGVMSCNQLNNNISISEPTVAIVHATENMKVGIKTGPNMLTTSHMIRIYSPSSYILIEEIGKSNNRDTQSIIITSTTPSNINTEEIIQYPDGYDADNCIIRSVNLLGPNGYFSGTRDSLAYQVQLTKNGISILVEGTNAVSKDIIIELSKKSSVLVADYTGSRYSATEEVPIGIWIDNKTIYRRYLDITEHITGTDVKLRLSSLGITDVDTICDIKGWLTRNDLAGYKVPIPWACYDSSSWNMGISASPLEVRLEIGSSYLSKKAKVEIVIEYTKK